jgi:CRP/FNR family cyclic AMP-dependent transcriptional regulator
LLRLIRIAQIIFRRPSAYSFSIISARRMIRCRKTGIGIRTERIPFPIGERLQTDASASPMKTATHLHVQTGLTPAPNLEPRHLDLIHLLAQARPGTSVTNYHADEIIFAQGDASDSVFFIQTGKAKVTIHSEQGKEAVIAILGPGQFCGEACLTGQRLRVATLRTMTECGVVRLDKAEIDRLLEAEPAFSALFISHLLARNIRVEEDLVDQLFNSTEKRLARLLLILAHFGQAGHPEPVIAKIKQETLAEMIGTTRSRVNFFMNKFRKSGFIDYNGCHFKVHPSLLNMVLKDETEIMG